MSPFMVSSVVPSSLLESIAGFVSRISNIEVAESLALFVSGAKALLWETPTAVTVKAKKTCTKPIVRTLTILIELLRSNLKNKV